MLWLLWIGRARECSAHHTNNAMCCKHIGRRWKSASEKSFVGKMRRKQPKIEFNGGTTIIGTNALCTKHYTREYGLTSVFSSAVEKWCIIFVACMNCAMVDENMVERKKRRIDDEKRKMFCHGVLLTCFAIQQSIFIKWHEFVANLSTQSPISRSILSFPVLSGENHDDRASTSIFAI